MFSFLRFYTKGQLKQSINGILWFMQSKKQPCTKSACRYNEKCSSMLFLYCMIFSINLSALTSNQTQVTFYMYAFISVDFQCAYSKAGCKGHCYRSPNLCLKCLSAHSLMLQLKAHITSLQ